MYIIYKKFFNMNWCLSLAIYFTFMFVIYAIQSINFYIYISNGNKTKTKINDWLPIFYAAISSIFWGLI